MKLAIRLVLGSLLGAAACGSNGAVPDGASSADAASSDASDASVPHDAAPGVDLTGADLGGENGWTPEEIGTSTPTPLATLQAITAHPTLPGIIFISFLDNGLGSSMSSVREYRSGVFGNDHLLGSGPSMFMGQGYLSTGTPLLLYNGQPGYTLVYGDPMGMDITVHSSSLGSGMTPTSPLTLTDYPITGIATEARGSGARALLLGQSGLIDISSVADSSQWKHHSFAGVSPALSPTCAAIDPTNHDHVLIGETGVRSCTLPATASPISCAAVPASQGLPAGEYVTSMRYNAASSTRVIASTHQSPGLAEHLVRSDDGGLHFTALPLPADATAIVFATHPTLADVFVTAYMTGIQTKLAVTLDGGATFSDVPALPFMHAPHTLTIDAAGLLYVDDGAQMYSRAID